MPNFPSVIGLIGGPQRVQIIQGATVISLDASMSETHSRQSTPTEFELETGETISDHIVMKPFSLELTGIISDTPLSVLQAALTAGATAILPPVGVVAAGVVGIAVSAALSGSQKPSVQNFLSLLQLQEQRLPVTVLTSLRTYDNMFIKEVSVPRDAGNSNTLQFKLSLVQLLLVSPQTVNVNIFARPDLAAGESNVGQQGAAVINEAKRGLEYERKAAKSLGLTP